MRPRTLAVLFVVVAGLLAFIWFYERELPSSDERQELAKRVLRVEPDEVSALTVSRGESVLRLEREPPAGEAEEGEEAAWWLRQPLAAAADRAAVEELVDDLTGLEKERTLEAVEPAELGLAEPRARVVLETAGGEIELLVGAEVPASTTMVVAVEGRDEAYVVADRLWNDLVKPAGDWRKRDLGPASRDAVARIALRSAGGRVALGRRGESFWVEEPYVDRADRDLVSSLLGELTGLRAERFVDRPAGAPELAAGAVEVVLEHREEALTIELGGAAGEDGELRLARVGGQLVESRTDLAAAVARAPEEWRSRAWSGFEVFEIDRLEVGEGDGATVFERDAGDWLRDGGRVAYSPVSDLLYALTGVEADSVVEGPAPATEPLRTLVLGDAEGERRETLTLYPARDGASPARVSGREVTLLLGEGTVADLELKLEEALAAEEPAPSEDALEVIGED